MKAIQIEAFGDPAEVAKVVNIPDIGAPAAGEVVIALEASPINRGARPISKAGGALDHAWSALPPRDEAPALATG
jgi:hypothetical protein